MSLSGPPRALLACNPSSSALTQYVQELSRIASLENVPEPVVKSYKDAVYFNYPALGLSLLFNPQKGYVPISGLTRAQLKDDCLLLESIDIFNQPKVKRTASGPDPPRSHRPPQNTPPSFPMSSFSLEVPSLGKDIDITLETTGKELVQALGEPERKGGGSGPSSGSIDIWCEWTKHGFMIEFGGDEARGVQAWEKGKDAVWKVITIFRPKAD
jgi:hypothetical protein